MRTRIRFYDIAKGIAIIAVIAGHSVLIAGVFIPQGALAAVVYHICFTFHMPLFFIVSGYFMHPDRPFRWRRESRELLATYALTAALIVVLNPFIAFFRGTGVRLSLDGWVRAALYGAGDFGPYLWPVPFRIGALWFLLGLFWAHLLVHMAYRSGHPTPVILVLFVIGYGSAQLLWLPLSVQSGMTAAAFVYAGTVARRYDVGAFIRSHSWIGAASCVIWMAAVLGFGDFSMAMNQYGHDTGHVVLSIVGAFAGTVTVLCASILIDRHADIPARVLSLFGRNSLALLCVHIVEDDVMVWQSVIPALGRMLGDGRLVWLAVFVVRLLVDVLLAWLLFHVPRVNVLFFPYLGRESGGAGRIVSSGGARASIRDER